MSASIDARDAKYLTFYALSYTLDLFLRQTTESRLIDMTVSLFETGI